MSEETTNKNDNIQENNIIVLLDSIVKKCNTLSDLIKDSKNPLLVQILPSLVAIISILSTSIIHCNSTENQIIQTKYEVEFLSKKKDYADIMSILSNIDDYVLNNDKGAFLRSASQLEYKLNEIEPFFKKESVYDTLYTISTKIVDTLFIMIRYPNKIERDMDSFENLKNEMRIILKENLFYLKRWDK